MSEVAGTRAELRRLLYRHYQFAECVLESIDWADGGAVLDFRFDYVWSDTDGLVIPPSAVPEVKEGALRSDLDTPDIRRLRLFGVQELHLHNWILEGQLEALGDPFPGEGWSEVAVVDVERSSNLLPAYRKMRPEPHHLVVKWEGDRRIDVVFHRASVHRDREDVARIVGGESAESGRQGLYAVVRWDGFHSSDASPEIVFTVKEIVLTAEAAQAEVDRLNKLQSADDVRYFWQYTRLKAGS